MAAIYTEETPAPVKEAKGLHLITEQTPNGKKVQILLEELKDVYGTQWTTSLLDLETDEQKEDWFLRLNPNGKIPILIDNTQSRPFTVMESSVDLLYLQDTMDKDKIFGFDNKGEQSEVVQWLLFWVASQPMQSNLNYFSRGAVEKIPFVIDRFRTRTLEIYSVLESRLSGKHTGVPRDFLAGNGEGKYSIADIGTWPWLSRWHRLFPEVEMVSFPRLLEWIARITARPAVQRAISDIYGSEVNHALKVSTKA